MPVQQEEHLHRKGNALGVAFLILGLLGLAFASFEYSVYSQNRDALDWNEAWGADTPEQHDLVANQFVITVGAFLAGALFLMFGIARITGVYSYNKKLDQEELLHAVRQVEKPRGVPSGRRAFCDQCGAPLNSDSKFCPGCGMKL